jgi:DNA-binding transcriptional LysR family regulator
MLNWADLQILQAVADTGSLAGAGRRLELSHATIGRRLGALETTLGAKLVDRLPRSAVLTATGQEIAGLACQIGELAATIVRRGRGESSGVSGIVTVSAPPLIASNVIAEGLVPLLDDNPDLSIILQSAAAVISLGRGEADIAVRLAQPDQPSLIARRVATARMALYASPVMAARSPADWRFIGYDAALAHAPHAQWLEAYVDDRKVVLRTSDVQVQIAAARAGIGVAMLPCQPVDDDPGLVRVGDGIAPPERALWLVVHPDLRRSTAVRAVLDHLANLFKNDARFR